MIRLLSIFFLMTLGFTGAFGQNIDEEIGFKYVKAEYLMSTERMEDAIKELNDIIKVSPAYKDALMLRAQTRYKLGAYKGAKDDALKSIDAIGITLSSASLLGKIENAVGNTQAALNSLSAAIALGSDDAKIFELRAAIYADDNKLLSACEDWNAAADLGSTKGAIAAKKNCGRTTKKPKKETKVIVESDSIPDEITEEENDAPTTSTNDKGEVILNAPQKKNDTETGDDTTTSEDSGSTDTTATEDSSTDTMDEDIEDNSMIPEEDDTENVIEIDEDLTLRIYGQGIGKRKILDRPSILILSDQSGTVAVEVCINENGKIDYAEYDRSKSSLTKNSLVSLAIRKSKEFWFEKSDYQKQCGYILFEIKGSE